MRKKESGWLEEGLGAIYTRSVRTCRQVLPSRSEDFIAVKENTFVDQNFVIHFDDDPVRFTPDGKVSVLDAIKALTQLDCPGYLWDDLKRNHPEILLHCGSYSFQKGQSLPVVDNAGWDMIWMVLIDYLGDSDFSCPD